MNATDHHPCSTHAIAALLTIDTTDGIDAAEAMVMHHWGAALNEETFDLAAHLAALRLACQAVASLARQCYDRMPERPSDGYGLAYEELRGIWEAAEEVDTYRIAKIYATRGQS